MIEFLLPILGAVIFACGVVFGVQVNFYMIRQSRKIEREHREESRSHMARIFNPTPGPN